LGHKAVWEVIRVLKCPQDLKEHHGIEQTVLAGG
jgi:hypothetical protein